MAGGVEADGHDVAASRLKRRRRRGSVPVGEVEQSAGDQQRRPRGGHLAQADRNQRVRTVRRHLEGDLRPAEHLDRVVQRWRGVAKSQPVLSTLVSGEVGHRPPAHERPGLQAGELRAADVVPLRVRSKLVEGAGTECEPP